MELVKYSTGTALYLYRYATIQGDRREWKNITPDPKIASRISAK